MRKKFSLDLINVPQPCPKKWEEMNGNEKTRYCGSCRNNIHNISEMTEKEIRKLLSDVSERLCVRLEKDADGKIKSKREFHQIVRKSQITAGILSAVITFSASAWAQNQTQTSSQLQISITKNTNKKSKIFGNIYDEQKAIIPHAKIFLRNPENDSSVIIFSDENGSYESEVPKSAEYEFVVEQPGFEKLIVKNLKVGAGESLRIDILLKASLREEVGIMDSAPILEMVKPEISSNIQLRQTEDLFISKNRNSVRIKNKFQKGFGDITFTITDPADARIPGMTVILTNEKNKKKSVVLSDEAGEATFKSLPFGKYKLKVFRAESYDKTFKKKTTSFTLDTKTERTIRISLEFDKFAVVGMLVSPDYQK